jgi:flavin reductase (DIM6/NTAB) family NADH-FMN oxidoreductase RutF
MPVDNAAFRQALGRLAGGVTVVTTRLPDGSLAGITVTAFSSLSLQPPLVLVCIDRRAYLHDRLTLNSPLAVNLLAHDQERLSRLFASQERHPFEQAPHRLGATGAPLLEGTLASIEGHVVERLPGGDHTIVVVQVEETAVAEGVPLLYFRGAYRSLA